MHENGIQRAFLPPLVLHHLAQAASEVGDCLRSLREVITAGEQLRITPAIAEFFKRRPECLLENQYGPSETHVVSAFRMPAAVDDWPPLPPIGAAIDDVDLHVVDEDGQPTNPGETGELLVGGAAVASGYASKPQMTAERFVVMPALSEGTLYRTGDLVRQTRSGDLEFLGRRDDQVKVRGYRVELGDVEQALSTHRDLLDSAAAVLRTPAGEAALAAYLVPRSGAKLTATELRRFLAELLPDFMIPATFWTVPQLPTTHSGKVDRGALVAQAAQPLSTDAAEEEARTELEALVASVFADVLPQAPTGVAERFVDLGGDSLSAARIAAMLRRQCGREVSVADVLRTETAKGLAALLEQRIPSGIATGLNEQLATDELSYAQTRLWFLEQLMPGTPVLTVAYRYDFDGRVDADRLRQAFNLLSQKHEALRTTFENVEGEPRQRLHDALAPEFAVVDLTAGDDETLRQLVVSEARKVFDLENGPLVRALLIQLERQRHVLVLSLHHLVCDGWSIELVHEELFQVYESLSEAKIPSTEPSSLQYRHFAGWQRSPEAREHFDDERDFWRQQLGGQAPVLDLPTDHQRPSRQSYRGATVERAIEPETMARLSELARNHGASVFVIGLAIFAFTTSRFARRRELIVGTAASGRHVPGTEGLVGFFVNTLPIPLQIEEDESFADLIARTQASTLEALEHQDIPFELLVEALQPSRDLSHHPVVQTLFVVQPRSRRAFQLAAASVEVQPVHNGAAQFDLTVSIDEFDSGGTITWEYATDLFERSTIASLADAYARVTATLLEAPTATLREIPLVAKADPSASVLRRRRAAKAEPLEQSFRRVAAAYPDEIAVRSNETQLSYRELDERSDELAGRLRATGVGPGVPVGICMPRRAELVESALAVIKAQGAYVPFDPTLPPDRLRFMADDLQLALALVDDVDARFLPAGVMPISCHTSGDAAGRQRDVRPRLRPDAAYVIYTSGSTGIPKGVEVSVSNVARLFTATSPEFGFAPSDVWMMFHSFAFDVSVWEMWGALLHGGRLVIVSTDERRSPRAFWKLLAREQATVLNQTPSAFRNLASALGEDGAADIETLRTLIFAGETLEPRHLERWFELAGDESPRVYNMYGITETTVHSTLRRITRKDLAAPRSPIGRPLDDLDIVLADSHGSPVPAGFVGEILVGGAGVTSGYVGRDELTKERFVKHPLGDGSSGVAYRSGDLARITGSGELEYLGRADRQVKIRGFRVELGEVEAALRRLPEIDDATVIADRSSEAEGLLAFVIATDGALDERSAVADLRRHLPDYCMPSRVLGVDEFPRTANGKLDEEVLRELATAEPRSKPASRPVFAGMLEAEIAAIWRSVLGRDDIRAEDNFFELGGHSLAATRVAAQLNTKTGLPLKVEDVFRYPVLRLLAERASSLRHSAADASPIPRLGRTA